MTSVPPQESAGSMQQNVLAHWDLINRLALRRFHNADIASEAALFVMEKLAADDWQRLRQFKGRCRFASFLSSVVYRLLEDYARRRYGRMRVPPWIAERGGIWLLLFRLLCCERYSFQEAVLSAASRQPHCAADLLEQAAEKILAEVPACGFRQSHETYDDSLPVAAEIAAAAGAPPQPEQKEQRLLREALFLELTGQEPNEQQRRALEAVLRRPFHLEPEERLLLRLCHQDHLSVAKAGRMLGLNRFQVHGRLRRIYARLRADFQAAGCEEELRLLLD